MKKYLFILISLFCLAGRVSSQIPTPQLSEMRGIWVASVVNIDWPSEPGLSDETLRLEADNVINRVARMGLNAIFLQVRPSSDAIYKSDIEPLSTYLVGTDFSRQMSFDALEYWIAAAHRKGIELHAWVNPFRVTQKADFPSAENHIQYTHPDWLITYSEKLFLDPGLPQARDYVCRVVMDIVNRYDVDGIHFDDYFYPYPVKGETFNDDKSFALDNPDNLSRADWRRRNVTEVIRSVGDSIRSVKPWVQFGISPFGVWRNKRDDERGSNTRAGVTNYDVLYADIMKWIDDKMIDYVIPQIYWESGNKFADFDELEQWWSKLSTPSTRIFVGHAVYKINDGKTPKVGWNNKNEMPTQVTKVRNNPRNDGSVYFSYRQFNRPDIFEFDNYLANYFYKDKALQPPVCKGESGEINITHLERDGRNLNWDVEGDTSQVRFYVVFKTLRDEKEKIGSNESILLITDQRGLTLPLTVGRRHRYVYRVAAVDKYRRLHEMSRQITIRE